MEVRGALFLFVILAVCCCCVQGATNNYNLVLGYKFASPNGVNRTVLTINGTSPGPLITGKNGDTFIINVTNNLPVATVIHWHGLLQTNSNQFDGVGFVTQCPIAPGTSFVYNFTANQYGTYWYHAHTLTHYFDGLRGPFVIYNTPETYANDYDEDIVFAIYDWYNVGSWAILPEFLTPASGGQEPNPDSTLINGVGFFDCRQTTLPCTQLSRKAGTYTVVPGKRYRLRIINMSALVDMHFSIDNHNLTIIEADGVDYLKTVVPNLEINVAQRYSVIITADQPVQNYWIRASPMQKEYFITPRGVRAGTFAKAALNYQGALANTRPTTKRNIGRFQNALTLVPVNAQPAPGPVSININLVIDFHENDQGVVLTYINNVTYTNPATPYLFTSFYNNSDFGIRNGSVYTLPNVGDVVQLVIQNFDETEHPVHLHGHCFAVLGSGPLPYDPNTAQLNLVNPPLRDVFGVPANSWLVWRFVVNNPGTWLWHCHIGWHLAGGFAVVFNELPSQQITALTPQGGPQGPSTCSAPFRFPIDF